MFEYIRRKCAVILVITTKQGITIFKARNEKNRNLKSFGQLLRIGFVVLYREDGEGAWGAIKWGITMQVKYTHLFTYCFRVALGFTKIYLYN